MKKEAQQLFKFGREQFTVPWSCFYEMAVCVNDTGIFQLE